MSSPKQEISLHITIYIAPENVTKFFEYFKPAYEKVIAEKECTFFEVYQSPEDPGTLSWVENWTASVEWLFQLATWADSQNQNQLAKEYYKEYREVTEAMFIKPLEYKIVNVVGPALSYKAASGS